MTVIFLLSISLFVQAQMANPMETAKTGYDLDINLEMDQIPALGQMTNLTIELLANRNQIRNLKVEVITSNNISIDSRKNDRTIELLAAKNTFLTDVAFVVHQPGNHMMTIKVTGLVDNNKYTDRYEYVFFTTALDSNENTMGWPDNDKEDITKVINSMVSSPYKKDQDGLIEVAMADDELNMYVNHLDYYDMQSDIQGQLGMVSVTGTYLMSNRENNGTYKHANSLVQLVNGANGDHLAWSYTNSEGVFTFPAIVNPGSDGVSIRVYAVRFIAGGLGYGVCKLSFCNDNAAADTTQYTSFHSQLSPQITGILDGVHQVGVIQSPFSLTNNLRAMWIKHDMDEAHAHLNQNSLVRGPFTAEWSNTSTTGNFYSIGGNIHFKSDVANGTNHTVLHEIGHNVMFNAGTFPTSPTDCPNPHYVNAVSGTQCAWTEGWASAFANMVNDDPTRCFAPSASNCISYETDPSFDVCFPDWDCGIYSHQVEGHVTGALWDLYDEEDDGLDINVYGADEIYDIFEFSAYPAFLSWWSTWLSQGFPLEGSNSLFQNDIEFTQSYDINLHNIYFSTNLDPVEGESLAITVAAINSGDLTSVGTPVTLYRSFVPIFNGFEDPVVSYNYGLIESGDPFTPYFYIIEPNAGVVYYRACYADQHGLDSNEENNCSDVISVDVIPDLIFSTQFE